MTAKGMKEEVLPAARKIITAIRAWESASTSHGCPIDLKKNADDSIVNQFSEPLVMNRLSTGNFTRSPESFMISGTR